MQGRKHGTGIQEQWTAYPLAFLELPAPPGYDESAMKKLVVAFLVILLAVVLGTPFCRYGILGLVRGESFYQGRPTSYWRGVVKDWSGWGKKVEYLPSTISFHRRRPRFLARSSR